MIFKIRTNTFIHTFSSRAKKVIADSGQSEHLGITDKQLNPPYNDQIFQNYNDTDTFPSCQYFHCKLGVA